MGHGRFTELYNPHWGKNVFFWAGWVDEVVGNNVVNRKIRVLSGKGLWNFFIVNSSRL